MPSSSQVIESTSLSSVSIEGKIPDVVLNRPEKLKHSTTRYRASFQQLSMN